MSYQQCTRFRTTVNLDREYLWTESNNRQAETAPSTGMFPTFDENNLANSGTLTKK